MPKKRYFKFDSVAFNKLYNDFELNSNNTEEVEEVTETDLPCRKFEGFSF